MIAFSVLGFLLPLFSGHHTSFTAAFFWLLPLLFLLKLEFYIYNKDIRAFYVNFLLDE